MQTISIILLILVSIFMILLILIQRGKGGGLAGAFGGMGGQSAFGTKAGDTFTRITVWTAIVWFVLCIGIVYYLKHGTGSRISGFGSGDVPSASATPDGTSTPAAETSAPVSTPEPATPEPAKPQE
ncbi:MAG: preprotein translocase subunit SecG [Planctomycetaceae bacterium]|jgi:preprotein translocase subunit SecG|nr:preprotein translocase subunit SecG [Planctomycetaceae bacterium]